MFSQIKFLLIIFFQAVTAQDTININSLIEKINKLEAKSVNLSPDLKIVRNFHSQKVSETFTQYSHFLPQASLALKRQNDFFEERTVQLRALGLVPQDASWSIDYQWSLLNYGIIQSTRKASTEADKAFLEVQNKEKEYPINFNTYFLNYLLSKYKKATVENSLKKAEAGKKEAKLGFELGQKTKIDVLRSEANVVSLNSKKTSFIDEEQNARSKFIEFTGLADADLDSFENLSEQDILSIVSTITQKNNISQLDKVQFSNSPLIEGLLLDEKINNISLASLTQQEWPDLKVQGSYTNSSDRFSNSFHNPTRTHTVALVLTIPLFGGGSLISSNFENYFAKKQILYTITQKKLETENNLNNTLIKINALRTLVESLSLNVSQFEELYRLTLKSYQLGKSTLIELLEVQDNLLDSKINLAQNKIQFYTLSQNYLWQAGIQ